ncbi:hypothetical protein AB0M28_20855 [Streptomyces sp. NPDC051940]|uniref:hypothetical protein n=1 Tax=Streptomyces sp. NPDC051940 TaxID=3155675 RepID=UPI00341DF9B3
MPPARSAASSCPQLIEAGNSVVAATTSEAKTARLRDAGATAVVLDVLDAAAVRAWWSATGRKTVAAILHLEEAVAAARGP